MAKKKKLIFKCYCLFDNEDSIGGDYHGYIVTLDGKILASYGDYYHDKGDDKAEGFMEGYSDALGMEYTSDVDDLVVEDVYDDSEIQKALNKLNKPRTKRG